VQWLEEAQYGRKLGLDEGILERVQEKLIKIFTGVYSDKIPISTPPATQKREGHHCLDIAAFMIQGVFEVGDPSGSLANEYHLARYGVL
jgi:hypothetical protein